MIGRELAIEDVVHQNHAQRNLDLGRLLVVA